MNKPGKAIGTVLLAIIGMSDNIFEPSSESVIHFLEVFDSLIRLF